jgi:hypothetical protein
MHAVIDQVVFMKDSENKRTLVFFHDTHAALAQRLVGQALGDEVLGQFKGAVKAQNIILEKRMSELLQNEQKSSVMIITETNQKLLSDAFGEVQGEFDHDYKDEALSVVPRLFLKSVIPGNTIMEKAKFMGSQYRTINQSLSLLSIKADNGATWVVGDRERDRRGCNSIHNVFFQENWKRIKECLEEKPEVLSDNVKEVTIEYTQEYIAKITAILKEKELFSALSQVYCDKMVNIINSGLANGLSKTDHLALLCDHLVKAGQCDVLKELEGAHLRFVGSIFDAELLDYIDNLDVINKDVDLMVLLTGGGHAKSLISILSKENYRIDKELTIDNAESLEEIVATCIANVGIVNQFLGDVPISSYSNLVVSSDNN